MISIIIPTLNEEKFLPKLLESLTVQTVKDFEVIVVDGSSKDKTVELAYTFLQSFPNWRLLSAVERVFRYSAIWGTKGRRGLACVIDADSILLPYSVGRIEQYIKDERLKFFTAWCRRTVKSREMRL